MKITYILPGLKPAGGVRVAFEFANRLQARGHEITLVSVNPEETNQDWFPLNVSIISRAKLLKQATQNDLIVATGWQTAPLCLSLPAKARVYFVQMFETLFYRDRRRQLDAYATYQWPFDGFITVSKWLQQMLREEFQQESVIAYNVVNRDMFYPDPRFPKNGRVRVLIEGPRAFYKGVKDAYVAVAGLPVEVWSLSQEIPLGSVDRAFVLPSQEMIRHIYSSCDILIKTSWYEGRPLPHLEAMACGCALISSDMYATDDLIDGYNALIVPPRDVAATRAALIRLIEDEALRQRLIQGGLETAHRQDWNQSVSQMEQALADILTKAKTRPSYHPLSQPPLLHVALFNEGRKEQAQRRLEQLNRAISKNHFSLSLIDDGSQPEAIAYFAEQGFHVLTKENQPDDTAIWRQVVNQANHCPILLLSTLIRVDNPAWINRLLAQLEADPSIGMLGVKMVKLDGAIASAGGFIGPASKWALDKHFGYHSVDDPPHYFHNDTTEVDWLDSHCVVINAQAARALLDQPKIHPFGEGIVNYSLQVKQQGWRVVYFPQVMAWLEPAQTALEDFDFEELQTLDTKDRRRIARQKGLAHYFRVFNHDLKEYGLNEVLKRSLQWLRWILVHKT